MVYFGENPKISFTFCAALVKWSVKLKRGLIENTVAGQVRTERAERLRGACGGNPPEHR